MRKLRVGSSPSPGPEGGSGWCDTNLMLPFIHPDEQHEGHRCGKKETKGHGIKDRTQPIVIRKIAGYGRTRWIRSRK